MGPGPGVSSFSQVRSYDMGFEVTVASGPGIADGHIRIWANDVLIYDRDDLDMCKASPAPGAANVIRNGYLMGWANSGYTQTTVFKLQRVIVATERILI